MNSKLNAPSGAWIFVSYSHKDFEIVRQIRNELERRGHNPLLFFLKCLEDDNALLPELIREEIKAREWFILCESENSKSSRWVQQEVELIKGMEGKVFETIDLSKELETELHKIVRLSKRATVFLSYAYADHATAEVIRQLLVTHEFSVTSPENSGISTQSIKDVITKAIDEAVTLGFVLVLLSPASLTSQWCRYETEYALKLAAQSQRSNVIPVVIAPFPLESLPPQLANIQWFDLTTGVFEQRKMELIRSLKTREMQD